MEERMVVWNCCLKVSMEVGRYVKGIYYLDSSERTFYYNFFFVIRLSFLDLFSAVSLHAEK